ncbi:hypothetical protein COU77_02970 [Candidatus Peregrinibacteria bacterium CG10_big_fil_rev_8_21_14_0_10_49_16]|nr:MAG: hypothetical protein COW95_02485 [Candidatus Peregrinibacteria bacterium CG22_combo_CG10-13_8_21_14_all_49_11]PIR51997.1 MAG: hypothetical protein COU77_02970 [Candidatus Peregrinibacteria bacterium CG10_big_fil_rev_8_21_14_0_10_49_16]
MDNADIQKQCQKFLEDLGIPGFIVFGWQKSEKQYGFTYVNHKTPPAVTLKGMLWAAKDFAEKKL